MKMNNELEFQSRQQFRLWLAEHSQTGKGIWIIFGKGKTANTLKPGEALEEALCFGWIDGQIKPVDDVKYIKYFAPRREKSTWSEKNKKLAEKLIKAGSFTDHGLSVIERSKTNGSWAHEKQDIDLGSIVKTLADILKANSIKAYEVYNFSSESKQRQLARFYTEAKSEEVKKKRVAKIIEALIERKKGMLY
jgi:uncharacterized protein YdeI (YjbR/CyaY-like superfamily)